ncbi:MAG: carboxypeptidase regulatory-like domain-containing protein [Kofleriaceae bacterium]
MPGARAAILVFLVAVTSVDRGSWAAPQVEIKGKSQLSLTKVKTRADGVEVTGQLVDKLTNEGLPGQSVTVTIGAAVESAMTQPDGTFRVVMPADPGPGPVKVQLGYPGTRSVDRAEPLAVTTDPSKSQVELGITKVADEPDGARLRISALGDELGPVPDLPVELALAPQNTDAFHDVLAAKTGSEVSLGRRLAGGPGMYRLRATYQGDAHTQAATKEVLIELASSTITSMKLSATHLAYEADLVATGTVMDDDQRPVAGATVTLTTGDRRLAQGATTDTGTYRFSIEASVLGQGEFGIQVQADPGRTYVKPSRSEPEMVKVANPAPVPVSYTVAAFLATALAAAAFFVARRRPWVRLRRPPAPADGGAEADLPSDVAGGLVIAKPGLVSTLRRAQDDGFAGVVRDTVRGRPIEHAVVCLVGGATDHEVRTGPDGAFALEHLTAGEWRATVSAEGHVSERFAVTVPHRGELRGVRVDLVPVRERVFQLYRRAAEPILPEPRLWGIWSPRQIVDHVRTKRPTPALADLTDFVEEIYFSPRVAVESALAQATERVDRAIQERASRHVDS